MKLRVPWRVQQSAYRAYQQIKCLLSQLQPKKKTGLNISFFCNYQEHTTGATVAIACIANRLSKSHNVDAIIKPYSRYSSQYNLSVQQHLSAKRIHGQIVFVDIEQESNAIHNLLADGKVVVLTCHAFPLRGHGVLQPKLIKNLSLASYIHFVSEHQRSEFINHYPDIPIKDKSFVIPNYTRQSSKQSQTNNIGIVGFLSREPKNALLGIQLAQQSNANSIQCWGSDEIYGLDNPSSISKLNINGWTNDLIKMHNSFDVLLSASKFETFGLVVAEALSAGIPCALADIPVYRELYSDCDGVRFLTGNNKQDIESINYLLEHSVNLHQNIIDFWQKRFSNSTVGSKWSDIIRQLATK